MAENGTYGVGKVIVFPEVVQGCHQDNKIVFLFGPDVVCDRRLLSQGPMREFKSNQLVIGELFKTLKRPAMVEIDSSEGFLNIDLKPFEDKRLPNSLLTLAYFSADGTKHARVECNQALWCQRYQYRTGNEDLIAITTPNNLVIVYDPVADHRRPWVVLGAKYSRVSWNELGELQELVS